MYADKLSNSPSSWCLTPGPTGMRRARPHKSTSSSRASKESEPSGTLSPLSMRWDVRLSHTLTEIGAAWTKSATRPERAKVNLMICIIFFLRWFPVGCSKSTSENDIQTGQLLIVWTRKLHVLSVVLFIPCREMEHSIHKSTRKSHTDAQPYGMIPALPCNAFAASSWVRQN